MRQSTSAVRLNWSGILSLTGSLAVSVAIWIALIRVVQYFAK